MNEKQNISKAHNIKKYFKQNYMYYKKIKIFFVFLKNSKAHKMKKLIFL